MRIRRQLARQHRKRQLRWTAIQAGHLGALRRRRQPGDRLQGNKSPWPTGFFAEEGVEPWPKCGAQSGLPIGWYSHPAQGIKQIINGLIQAAVPH